MLHDIYHCKNYKCASNITFVQLAMYIGSLKKELLVPPPVNTGYYSLTSSQQ